MVVWFYGCIARRLYKWSTGDTALQIVAVDTGQYWVKTYNKYGCVSDKSKVVRVQPVNKEIPPPPPIISDDANINFCDSNRETLTLKRGGDYKAYFWTNGREPFLGYSINHKVELYFGQYTVYLRGMNEEGCWSNYNIHRVAKFYQFRKRLKR